MANAFVHVELASTDIAKSKEFYSKLFKWELNDMEMGPGMTYTIIKPESGTGGGMMSNPMPGAPSAWLAYVDVDDIHKSTEKARSLGATILRDVTEVPGQGHLSIIIDPTGAHLGLWQGPPAKK